VHGILQCGREAEVILACEKHVKGEKIVRGAFLTIGKEGIRSRGVIWLKALRGLDAPGAVLIDHDRD
jgi:hypothetical protein